MRKRRRIAKACEKCRSRKVKCDLSRPCGPCTRSRLGLECSYSENALGSFPPILGRIRWTKYVKADNPEPELGIRADDAPITDTAAEQALGSLLRPQLPNSHPEDIEARIKRLEQGRSNNPISVGYARTEQEIVHDLTERVAKLEREILGLSHPLGHEKPKDVARTTIPAAPFRLRDAPNKVRMFGESHWVHTAEKVRPPFVISLAFELKLSTTSCHSSGNLRWNQPLTRVRGKIWRQPSENARIYGGR